MFIMITQTMAACKGDLRLHVEGKSRLYSSHKTSEAGKNFGKEREGRGGGEKLALHPRRSRIPYFLYGILHEKILVSVFTETFSGMR
jgi:hypothetical protein